MARRRSGESGSLWFLLSIKLGPRKTCWRGIAATKFTAAEILADVETLTYNHIILLQTKFICYLVKFVDWNHHESKYDHMKLYALSRNEFALLSIIMIARMFLLAEFVRHKIDKIFCVVAFGYSQKLSNKICPQYFE